MTKRRSGIGSEEAVVRKSTEPATEEIAGKMEYFEYPVHMSAGESDRSRPGCESYPKAPLLASYVLLAESGFLGSSERASSLIQDELDDFLDAEGVPKAYQALKRLVEERPAAVRDLP